MTIMRQAGAGSERSDGEFPPALTSTAATGGLRAMSAACDVNRAGDFERIATALLARYVRQQGKSLPDESLLRGCAGRLAEVLARHGLPRPLAPGECGSPGGMPEAEVGTRVAAVLGPVQDETVAEGVKQLVKACFYPEFTVCRDSYREVARDGGCRRQDPARVRGRISGTHCVDCPYWVALEPEAHRLRLAAEWVAGPEAWARDREMFLPEDFRELRRWLWRAAREGWSPQPGS